MAGNPWLALPQYLHYLTHGEFQLPDQQYDSQPRRIG
jgi:hypothetical protein